MKKKRSLLTDVLVLVLIFAVAFGVLQAKKLFEPKDYKKSFEINDEEQYTVETNNSNVWMIESSVPGRESNLSPIEIVDNNMYVMHSEYEVIEHDDSAEYIDYGTTIYRLNMDTDEKAKLFSTSENTHVGFIREIDGETIYALTIYEEIEPLWDENFQQNITTQFKETKLYKIAEDGTSQPVNYTIKEGDSIDIKYVSSAGVGDNTLYFYNFHQWAYDSDEFKMQLLMLKDGEMSIVEENNCHYLYENGNMMDEMKCDESYKLDTYTSLFFDNEAILVDNNETGSRIRFVKDNNIEKTVHHERFVESMFYDKETQSLLYRSNNDNYDSPRMYRYDIKNEEEFELPELPLFEYYGDFYKEGNIYHWNDSTNYLGYYNFKKNTYYSKAIKMDRYFHLNSVVDNKLYVSSWMDDAITYYVYELPR